MIARFGHLGVDVLTHAAGGHPLRRNGAVWSADAAPKHLDEYDLSMRTDGLYWRVYLEYLGLRSNKDGTCGVRGRNPIVQTPPLSLDTGMGPIIRWLAVLCIAAMIRECAASSEATAEDSPVGNHAAPDFMRPGQSPSSTECHSHQTELERALQGAEELERQLVAMQVRLPGRVVQLWQGERSPCTDVAVTGP